MCNIKSSDKATEKDIATDRTLSAINSLINELIEKYNLDYSQIIEFVSKKQKEELLNFIPVYIFKERPLGILEAAVKFLKEERKLSFNQIAKLFQRDNRTVWSSYHNAVKKKRKRFAVKKAKMLTPIEIFSDRKIGLLEALSFYLREKRKMSFREIGLALNRDERTIWTSCHAAMRKRAGYEK